LEEPLLFTFFHPFVHLEDKGKKSLRNFGSYLQIACGHILVVPHIQTLPCVIILKLICLLFVMFQGERASCYSRTADRVFVFLSVKYDWRINMSLCDLWKLCAMFFNTSSGLHNNALLSSTHSTV
jgi:hypothetical protein